MGVIGKVIEGGIPVGLVISVVPGDFNPMGGKIRSPGKQPAVPYGDAQWMPALGWENGMSAGVLKLADDAGANAGLRLGSPHNGVQFYCLDFDLDARDDEGVALLEVCLSALQSGLGGVDYAVRKTLDWRGSVLLQVPGDADPGRKRVIKLFKSGQPVGKIELLGLGQQTVIAGKHPSGRQLMWSKRSAPNVVTFFPQLRDDWIPKVPTYAHVATLLEIISLSLRNSGYEVDIKSSEGTIASRLDLPALSPEQQLAPSATLLLRVLHELPNPASVDREQYIRQQLSVVACVRAMLKFKKMTVEEGREAFTAAIDWAARWEGPSPPDAAAEREKFIKDFFQRSVSHLGWRHIASFASSLGVQGIATEEAQETFPPFEDAPKPPRRDDTDFLDRYDRVRTRHRAGQVNVATAETLIADKAQLHLNDYACYLPQDKRWIVWGGPQGWDSKLAESEVTMWVDGFLHNYVTSHQMPGATELQTSRDIAAMLSHKRVTNIVSLLKYRMSTPSDMLDKGEYVIQTPTGAIDLRTGEKVPSLVQRNFMDTRSVSVSPKEGPTPLFDDLVWNLSDRNEDVLQWLLSFLGYSMLGQPNEHCFVFLWGPGGNGKSLLLSVLKRLLGGYACALDRDVLLTAGRDKHPASLMRLKGARLSLTSEMPPNEKWNEARLKALTGRDETEARLMGVNPITFKPEAAFLITGQYIPVFHKVDRSIARRFRVIGTTRIPQREDKALESKIVEREMPAMLFKLMGYARKVYDNGLTLPPVPRAMQREANRYLMEQDKFHGWFVARCISNHDKCTAIDDLRADYDAFVRENCADGDDSSMLDELTASQFSQALRRNGCVTEDDSGKKLIQVSGEKRVVVVQGMTLKN